MVNTETQRVAGNDNGAAQPLAMSVRDAARLAGISRATLYREIATRRLRTVKVGKRRLVRTEALRAWLDSLPASTAA
jgi:excisionase family DNA binding protein